VTVSRNIAKLQKEVARIESIMAPIEGADPADTLFPLQLARDHLIRSGVIETHLAMEDLLVRAISGRLLQGKPKRSVLRHPLSELHLRFPQLTKLAQGLGLITRTEAQDLERLNNVRNACGHNWQHNLPRGKGKAKRPTVHYMGKDIYPTLTPPRSPIRQSYWLANVARGRAAAKAGLRNARRPEQVSRLWPARK
jgi:hypothetical protein